MRTSRVILQEKLRGSEAKQLVVAEWDLSPLPCTEHLKSPTLPLTPNVLFGVLVPRKNLSPDVEGSRVDEALGHFCHQLTVGL